MHGLRKGPKRLRLPAAAVHLKRPKALGSGLPQRRGDLINSPPLTPPEDVTGALHLARPMFPFPFQPASQPHRQDAIVKGIVGLRKVAFPLKLLHDLDNDLRTLFVLTSMAQMME